LHTIKKRYIFVLTKQQSIYSHTQNFSIMEITASLYFGNTGYGNLSQSAKGFVLGFNPMLLCRKQECIWHTDGVFFHRNANGGIEKITNTKYHILCAAFKKQSKFREYFYSSEASGVIPECREAAFKNPKPISGSGSFDIEIEGYSFVVNYCTNKMQYSANLVRRHSGMRYLTDGFLFLKISIALCNVTNTFKGWTFLCTDEHAMLRQYDGKKTNALCEGDSFHEDPTPMDACKKVHTQIRRGFYPNSTYTYYLEWVYFMGCIVFYNDASGDNKPILSGRIEKTQCLTAQQCADMCSKMLERSY